MLENSIGPGTRSYRVREIQPLYLKLPERYQGNDLMSPYVWVEGGVYWMALRVVDGTSSICFAYGDGINFELAETPALTPGPSAEDLGGCEDPTLFFHEGRCKLYYTGWNAHIRESRLLFASGPDISQLTKHGDVLHGVRHWNLKEATIVQTPSNWRLFYEYSENIRSLIGMAHSDTPDGGWQQEVDPFSPRENSWDSWHLSTGPIALEGTENPVMFYNGSDKDARWRIGWVEFDPTYKRVTRRCEEPLIAPEHLPDGFPDIAFAASSLPRANGAIDLYFSFGDRRLCRAIIDVFQP